MTRRIACPMCGGTGDAPFGHEPRCPCCHGDGQTPCPDCHVERSDASTLRSPSLETVRRDDRRSIATD